MTGVNAAHVQSSTGTSIVTVTVTLTVEWQPQQLTELVKVGVACDEEELVIL
jgi:hypothetical protein